MNAQVNREAKLKWEAVEPSELSQIEGGIAGVIFGLGLGFAAGAAAMDYRNRQDAKDASEMAAVLSALKQGGII